MFVFVCLFLRHTCFCFERRYGVDCVVANLLHTRYERVSLVNGISEDSAVVVERSQEEGALVEERFIPRLIELHRLHIQ